MSSDEDDGWSERVAREHAVATGVGDTVNLQETL